METKEKTPPLLWSCRMTLAVFGFLGFCNLYMLRVNMSVAMVCMVNQTALDDLRQQEIMSQNQTTILTFRSSCASNTENSTKDRQDGEFTWDKETQGIVLGSFFWGYIGTQIIGGWLATKFGGKRVFGWFMFVYGVTSLLTPVAARTSKYFLIVLRVIGGLCQGVVWPSMQSLWASWAPPLESSFLGGFGYAGAQIGNVITFPVAGFLCEYGFDGGWASIFYVFGSLSMVWFAAWMFFVYDTPTQHPRISEKEKRYIVTSLQGKISHRKNVTHSVPWIKIITSRPVWAIFIAHTCANWGTYTFLTNIPTYMKEVLKFDIKQNGLLSALPYIGFWAMVNISGSSADFLRKRKLLNTTQARKLFNTLGMIVPAAFVTGTGFMDCNQSAIAVSLLTIGVAFSGCQYGSGFLVNPGDIVPRYAGIIFGISNTFATIPGFVVPILIGKITSNQTQEEWQAVFYIAAGIYVFGALVFIIFGSGDLQDWTKELIIEEENVKETELISLNENQNSPRE